MSRFDAFHLRLSKRLERLRNHRESWKRPEVAEQMERLAEDQLQHPEDVAPYRTFLAAIQRLTAEYPLPEPAELLDVGCGVGQYSELVERYFPHRFVYTGYDYAEAMVETARRRWPDRRFAVNDLFAETTDLSGYDVIVAGALVDVLDDWERALDVLLGSGAQYVLLHRQQVSENGASRVEVVPGYEGQTTYRSYVSRGRLGEIAARHGRELAEEFEVDGPVRTFLFRRTGT